MFQVLVHVREDLVLGWLVFRVLALREEIVASRWHFLRDKPWAGVFRRLAFALPAMGTGMELFHVLQKSS